MEIEQITGLNEQQVKQAIQDRQKRHTSAQLSAIKDGSEMIRRIKALDKDLLEIDINNSGIKDALCQLADTLGRLVS